MINYSELNKEQYEAVTTIKGPVAINAGAGTGKTRVLTYRTMYMIESGINPENILLLTFTNKAANEMKERIQDLLNDSREVTACTFHSFCIDILKKYGKNIGLDNFSLISSGDEEDIFSVLKEKKYQSISFPESSVLVGVLSSSINTQTEIKDIIFKRYKNKYSKIEELFKEEKEYKEKKKLLTFDDLLTKTIELFQSFPEITKEVAEKYKYIMVDEYQDSNKIQEKLLFLICKYHDNIAIVGDAVQSLYGFRGADVSNILDFPKHFENCKKIYLRQNYRSTKEIIEFSNKITECVSETKPHRLVAQTSGMKPQVIITDNQSKESKKTIELVKYLLSQEKQKAKDICILYRNSYSANFVETLLKEEGINYKKFGGKKIFEISYIRNLISLIKILENDKSFEAWYCALQMIKNINSSFLLRISERCSREGVEGLMAPQYKRRIFHPDLKLLYDFITLYKGKINSKNIGIVIEFYCQYLNEKLNETNFSSDKSEKEKRKNLLVQIENIKLLENLIHSFDSLSEFFDSVSNDKIIEEETDSVCLSTVHSSKGLEYKNVIILDCIDGIFPSTELLEADTKEDNEDLRCFYVAVTRAKEKLYMMVPKTIFHNNGIEYAPMSHFLKYGINNCEVESI